MTKRMLIDATHAEETRVVVLNGSRLEEFDVETSTKKQLKGNIYLAKVVRVEPSLQAAFVDYGGNRHGFLAFNEIHPDYYQIPVADREKLIAEQEAMNRSAAAEHGDGDGDENAAPRVRHSEGDEGGEGGSDEQSVEALGGDDIEDVEHRRPRMLRHYKIQEVVKHRQILLVQVVKEERGTKGAALTTFLSLAGRYCVLMPNTSRGGGVSRKITNVNDRKRLKSIINELQIPDGMGVIVRTAGSERTKPEVKRDCEYLLRLWDSVRELTLSSTSPALVYEEANLIKRSIRDLYSRDIDEVQVDGEEGYRLAKDFMRMLTPSHAKKVQLYKDPGMPLFHRFQVEGQLDAMHSASVQLRSGGYLVFNQTEALVAIDVNSGRATRERHIEETALKTNLEAADEVGRQLRLRDLAGLIVIDFIDMEETRNNHAVERRVKEAMRNDRARIQLGRISAFGLLELSRQRLRPSLMESSFLPCAHCGGTGLVRSTESAALHILRVIEEEGIRRRSSEMVIAVHPMIALYILNNKRAALLEIEQSYGLRVLIEGDETLIQPTHRVERTKLAEPGELPPLRVIQSGSVAMDPEDEEPEIEETEDEEEAEAPVAAEAAPKPAPTAEDGEAVRRRRRRRRRGGRRDEAGAPQQADGEAQPGTDADAESGAEGEESGTEGEGEILEAGESVETSGQQVEGEARANGEAQADSEAQARRRRRGKRGGRRRAHRPEGASDGMAGDENDPVTEGGTEFQAEGDLGGGIPVEALSTDNMEGAVPFEPNNRVEGAVEAEGAAEARPSPRPRRRRRAAADEAAPSGEPVAGEGVAAETAEPAPRRRPARRKATGAEIVASSDQEAPVAETPAFEPPVFEPPVFEPPVFEAGASEVETYEPHVAQEITAPESAPVEAEASAATEPPVPEEPELPPAQPRRGWWNRFVS